MQVDGLATHRVGTIAGMSARAGVSIIVALFTATLLAACSPTTEPAPTPTVETSTPTPEPSVEPVESTPTPEEPSITEYSISRESVARLIEMPVDQFSLESKQEQLKLVAFYMQGSDNRDNLPTFAKYYAATTDDPKDILPVISADNSFQEVATVMAYSKRYVYALTGDDREKFLIAALQDETSSGAYAPLKTVSDELPTTSPKIAGILAATNVLRASTATGTSGMLSDETGTFQDITFQDGQTNRIYYHEIPVDTGVFKIWINK